MLCALATIAALAALSSASVGFANDGEMHAHFATYGEVHNHAGAHVGFHGEPHDPAAVLGGGLPLAGGAVWSRGANTAAEWEMTVRFRIDGPGEIGGNGLALWYTEAPGRGVGPVMGAPDRWRGLGVLVDTHDDDHDGANPAIMGIMNDGSVSYDAARDGDGQYFAGCLRPLRNQEHPVAARLSYRASAAGGVLKLELGDAPHGRDPHWATCFEHDGVHLPPGYYFGVSGSTNEHPDTVSVYDMHFAALHAAPGAHAIVDQVHHAMAGKDTAHVSTGHRAVHAANEEHLRELREHVGTLTQGLQHMAGTLAEGHEHTLGAADELRHELHELRAEMGSYMAHIREHFETEHAARGAGAHVTHGAHEAHAAHDAQHRGAFTLRAFGVFLASQVGVIAGFLLAKDWMDRRRERARKWA